MKTKTIISTLAIGLILGVTSPVVAFGGGPGHRNCDGPMMGQMMNQGAMGQMMGGVNSSLTPAQQQKVTDIEAGYQEKLQVQEAAISAKMAELDNAYADDKTTLVQAQALRQELFNLQQDYRVIRRDINVQISDELGIAYFGGRGMGMKNCAMNGTGMGGHGRGMLRHGNQRH